MGQASYRCWQLPEGGRQRKERQRSPLTRVWEERKWKSQKHLTVEGGAMLLRRKGDWVPVDRPNDGGTQSLQAAVRSCMLQALLAQTSLYTDGVREGFWDGKRYYLIKGVIIPLPFPSSLQVNQILGYSVFLERWLIDLIELILKGKDKNM